MAATSQKVLATKLAKKKGISVSEAEVLLKDVVNVILDEVVDNDGGVIFKGQFTLFKKLKKGRSGVMNGTEYNSPDKYVLKIKTGSELEKALNR